MRYGIDENTEENEKPVRNEIYPCVVIFIAVRYYNVTIAFICLISAHSTFDLPTAAATVLCK